MRQSVPFLVLLCLLGCFDLGALDVDGPVDGPVGHSENSGGGQDGSGGSGPPTGGIIHCFPGETAIDTPAGSRPIAQLRVGDEVWGYDQGLAQRIVSVVTALHRHEAQPLGVLETESGQVLHLTSEHPVFSVEHGRYVPAAEFESGMEMLVAALPLGAADGLSPSHGQIALLPTAARGGFMETARVAPVFNLTVAGTRNYFASGVLVHNKSPCEPWMCGGGCPCQHTGGNMPLIEACFGPGTPIDTPAGPRAIEALTVGDAVWAFDHLTEQRVIGSVTATHHHGPGPVGRLRSSDGLDLHVTGNHPVFDSTQLRYVPASDMANGAQVVLASDGLNRGSQLTVAQVRFAPAVSRESRHNLTVAGHHNYFAGGVLVHNKSAPCTAGFWPVATCGPCPAWEHGGNCQHEIAGPCVDLGLACAHPVVGVAPVCANDAPATTTPAPLLEPFPSMPPTLPSDAGILTDGASVDGGPTAAQVEQRAAYIERLVSYFGFDHGARGRLADALAAGMLPVALIREVASPRGTLALGEIVARWLAIPPNAQSAPTAAADDGEVLGEFVNVVGRTLATPNLARLGYLLPTHWQHLVQQARLGSMFASGSDHLADAGLPHDRRSLLSTKAFLRAHPTPSDRGHALARALLCEEWPAHNPPALAPTVTSTRYAAYAELAANPFCAQCHRTTDGLGLALEQYDAQGDLRLSEGGVAISPAGRVHGSVVVGVEALSERLATVATGQCIARSLLQSALGRPLRSEDACSIDWVVAGLGVELDLRKGIVSVATSPAFEQGAAQ